MKSDSSDICAELECWFARSGGEHLLEHERLLVNQMLEKVFGYHLLQLGVTRDSLLAAPNTLNHTIYACNQAGGDINLLADQQALPFPCDSIDAIILHHALEFSDNPHQLLREVHRVLSPNGHLIVLGINPYSAFGLSTALRGIHPDSLWHQQRGLSSQRLRDWLHLLGSEVLASRHTYAFPPLGKGRWFSASQRIDGFLHRHQWPVGGVYALHAQKKVIPFTPIRKPWQRRLGSGLLGLGVSHPVSSPRNTDHAA
jgi:SAM-dependent methyltransferase